MTSHYHSPGLTHRRDQIFLHHLHWNNNRMSYIHVGRISSQGMVMVTTMILAITLTNTIAITIITMYRVSMRLITTTHIRMKNSIIIIIKNILPRIGTFYKILHNVMTRKLFSSIIINIRLIMTLLSIIGMGIIKITTIMLSLSSHR